VLGLKEVTKIALDKRLNFAAAIELAKLTGTQAENSLADRAEHKDDTARTDRPAIAANRALSYIFTTPMSIFCNDFSERILAFELGLVDTRRK
jgi:hypothetical protein